MSKVLSKKFFNRDTEIVAKELLGKFLVRKIGSKKISVMITETEAYNGPEDKASHAFKGKTKRNEPMFGQPGVFYVYLCYGMYYMLNIVTRERGYPAAVLIRGAVLKNSNCNGLAPLKIARARSDKFLMGPGKLTKFLKIDREFNGKKSGVKTGLWFENRGVKIRKFKKTARIGVGYAGPVWCKKKLRFHI